MHPIHHIRPIAGVLAVLAALVAFATTPAFAMSAPMPGGGGPAAAPHQLAPVHTVVHTVVAGGMPGWQITLIAVGAALLTAAVAVLLDRARGSRRNVIPAAA